MMKHDRLWSDLNNLLSHLRNFGVVDLVSKHYAKYNNDAPPALLVNGMEKLQAHLDSAEDEDIADILAFRADVNDYLESKGRL